MAEYIEREAAIAEILKGTITTSDLYGMGVETGMDVALERVKSVPTADVEPVRHGRWIPVSNTGIGVTGRCTVCNKAIYGFVAYNYCPNCGARMDLEVGE